MPTLNLFSVVATLPAIKLRIRGVEHYFIIDTGAEMTCVSSEILGETAGLRVSTETMHGVGGTEHALRVFKPFNLFGKQLNKVVVSAAFLRLRQDHKCNISGIIGQDLLRQFKTVTFDNENKTVRFSD